jgi:hypothetical protein
MNRFAIALAACALLLAPAAASAQAYPSYVNGEQRLSGRVIEFKPWNLQLDRGPHIVLHPGTVIKPTGLNLANGMYVQVFGHIARDGAFAADEVDLTNGPPPAFRRYGW